MAEVTLDNSRIKSLCPGVNYRVPLKEGLSETVSFLRENFSTRPLDECFNMMCDAVLSRHREYRLPDDERAIAERYISQSSNDYLRVLKMFTLMRKSEQFVRPPVRMMKRAVKFCLRI
ncbi:MAG: hypothetical protein IJP86_01465 [Synergistaceae bacterium]|nr:hypothetical protein [Synergistaceae bacterium]